ncbi:eukaryotic rRNA processing protein EBP2-domain-containing protein [Lipomyces orientalis]|uniref:Eukaryotic rRNA processing protein EBP2-domain-containing protein n=1 Tax=Lipomyces orientalis TaxID=1233043 RepID=A0ACC3TG04_9ASCO
MVSKLRTALSRHRGVDHEAIRLKTHQKRLKKEKVQKSTKKPRLDVQESQMTTKSVTKKSNKKPKKVPAKVMVESETEDESSGQDAGFEDVDTEEEEEGYEEVDDPTVYPARILDTSKLEDDLSSDSESDDEEDVVRKPTPKKSDMLPLIENAKREQEDEEDVALSDLPTDSGSDDEDGEVVDMIPHQKLTVNNVKALKQSLSTIAFPTASFAFNDHMSVTSNEPTTVEDVNNDLTRELAFYNQALAAVTKGRSALLKEKISFSRPEDYFAEMVKSDSHMEKLARRHSADKASVGKSSSKGKNKKRK